MQQWKRSSDGGVEAFEVADLKDAAMRCSGGDERVRLCQRGGDGLFNEEIEAGGEQLAANPAVVHSGYAKRDGGDAEPGSEEFVDGVKDGNSVLSRNGSSDSRVGVYRGGESDGAGGLKFAIDAQMVAAEGACADDSYANWIETWHCRLITCLLLLADSGCTAREGGRRGHRFWQRQGQRSRQ